jgi:hypothetical protein
LFRPRKKVVKGCTEGAVATAAADALGVEKWADDEWADDEGDGRPLWIPEAAFEPVFAAAEGSGSDGVGAAAVLLRCESGSIEARVLIDDDDDDGGSGAAEAAGVASAVEAPEEEEAAAALRGEAPWVALLLDADDTLTGCWGCCCDDEVRCDTDGRTGLPNELTTGRLAIGLRGADLAPAALGEGARDTCAADDTDTNCAWLLVGSLYSNSDSMRCRSGLRALAVVGENDDGALAAVAAILLAAAEEGVKVV